MLDMRSTPEESSKTRMESPQYSISSRMYMQAILMVNEASAHAFLLPVLLSPYPRWRLEVFSSVLAGQLIAVRVGSASPAPAPAPGSRYGHSYGGGRSCGGNSTSGSGYGGSSGSGSNYAGKPAQAFHLYCPILDTLNTACPKSIRCMHNLRSHEGANA